MAFQYPVAKTAGLMPAKFVAMIPGDGIPNALASGYGTNIFDGDPVSVVNGTLAVGDGTNTNGVCTSFDAVFKGWEGGDAENRGRIRPGWVAGFVTWLAAGVYVHLLGLTEKGIKYVINTDTMPAATSPLALIGKKANLNVGAGMLVNGMSGATLNVASIGTGTAVIIEGVCEGPDSYLGSPQGTVQLLVRNAKNGS